MNLQSTFAVMFTSVYKTRKLTVMVGLPGSGKTTKAMQLAAENSNAVLLSRDKLRKEIHFADESNLTAHMVELASSALSAGNDVIVDSPNLHKSDKVAWTSLAAQHKAKLHFAHMDAPVGIVVNRDAKRPQPVGLAKIKSMLKAAGTSEGAEKGWDTRGRGRKQYDVQKLEEKLKEAVRAYQFQEWSKVPLLRKLAQLTVKGGPLEHFHPGAMTLYRGGTPYGVSWSKDKAVGKRYAEEFSWGGPREGQGKLHEVVITKNTPAIDVQRLTRGFSVRSRNEREVFLPNSRGMNLKTKQLKMPGSDYKW